VNKCKTLLLILLGLLLRLLFLGKASFWFDEATSACPIYPATLFGGIQDILKVRNVSPLYWVFISYLGKISISEVFLRLSSVIFALGTFIVSYLVVKRFIKKEIARIYLFLLLFSPLHVYYSQEARMYTLLTFITALASYFLLKALTEKKNIDWAWYGLFSFLGLYIHYIMVFILLAQSIFVAMNINRRLKYRDLKSWILTMGVLLILFIPWIRAVILRLIESFRINDFGWMPSYIPSVGAVNLFYTFKNFNLGYNLGKAVYLFYLPVIFIIFLIGVVNMVKKEKFFKSSFVFTQLFFPVAVIFFLCQWKIFYVDRHFLPCLMFYYIILSYGLFWIKNKNIYIFRFLILSIFITLMAGILNYYNFYLPGSYEEHVGIQSKKDHRAAARYTAENFKDGDIILHTGGNTTYPFKYYFRRFSKLGINNMVYLTLDSDKDMVVPFELRVEAQDINLSEELHLYSYQRVWLIFSTWQFPNSYLIEDYEDFRYSEIEEVKRIKEWFDRNYLLLEEERFKGVSVYLYEQKV